MGDAAMKLNCLKILLCVGMGLVFSGCGEQKYGYCTNTSDADEDRAWVWIYENAGIAENRKCILCYLDRSDPDDRCYYFYNDDFMKTEPEKPVVSMLAVMTRVPAMLGSKATVVRG